MIGNLFRLGFLGWLATKAYNQLNEPGVKPSDIKKHMEVVGSDGIHVGTVDHLAVKLTKSDPGAQGMHHIIPLESVASMSDGKLMLNVTAREATDKQQAVLGKPPAAQAPATRPV